MTYRCAILDDYHDAALAAASRANRWQASAGDVLEDVEAWCAGAPVRVITAG